jgi:cis-L-3-hydroxyproline dehydratase
MPAAVLEGCGNGDTVQPSVRPEKIVPDSCEPSMVALDCTVAERVYVGTATQVIVDPDSGRAPTTAGSAATPSVSAGIPSTRWYYGDADTRMRIDRVDIYGYDLRYAHGDYVMSGDRVVNTLPSTVVRIVADDGVEGFGEVCPLGATYLPGFGEGARAALRELAPALVGLDPRQLGPVWGRMDAVLRGHEYAKSAVDIACWDVLGRAASQPLATLLGGRRQERFPLYVAIPLGPAGEMVAHVSRLREQGIRRFQLKVGGDPYEDAERTRSVVEATGAGDVVVADANGGWRLQDAVVAARLLEPLERVYLEQPCSTLDECLYIRERTSLPMVLDEAITGVESLLAAHRAGGMEAFNLKISKVGGLTRARLMRDLAEALGLRVTIEDTWGGDLVTAAVSHLAASTGAETLFTASFMNDWTLEHVAGYEPRSRDGFGSAPSGPGLGVDVDTELLGAPLFTAG